METLIESMLAKVVAEGFDKSAIDASINTLEFSIREIDMSDVSTRATCRHGPQPRALLCV